MNIYDYQRPLGKIEDDSELRDAFVAEYDIRDKEDMVRFGLLLGRHLLEITGFEPCVEVQCAFAAMGRWLDKKASYHEARNTAFGELYKGARLENDLVKERFFRTMAQISCIPHCKYHALWATDFAITLVNRMRPGDLGAVKRERKAHIGFIQSIAPFPPSAKSTPVIPVCD